MTCYTIAGGVDHGTSGTALFSGGGDMPNAADIDGILLQNLADAGCGPETVCQCMALAQKRDQAE